VPVTRRSPATIRAVSRPSGPRVRRAPEPLQAARLHGMAELAQALGHEVNNMLAAIVLQLEILAQDLPASGASRESVTVLETAAQQGTALVRRVRELARLSRTLVPRPVDLRAAVDDALGGLAERLATLPHVEVVAEHAEAPAVLGDRAELAVAVRELVGNALDAMADGGRVRVVTRAEGGSVVCRVTDDGDGVSPDVLARAFEPFVSTRSARGRGLGLTIALAVAARHDGDVRLAPAPGGGTVATLRVPRTR
jgi:signal transduction histidine kinase